MKRHLVWCAALAFACGAASTAQAISLISPGDPIIAIDMSTGSATPGAEGVEKILDGLTNTKYLNFGKDRTGFIVTPAAASILQSFVITTANDAEGRDPANYELYGTNDPITSVAHGRGDAETWTLIQQGDLALPALRQTAGTAVDVANAASYASYKMIFPDLKDTAGVNSMQVAGVAFYDAPAAGGSSILAADNSIIAIRDNPPFATSNYPANEAPAFAIDGNTASKYLNFGKELSGFIVTPSIGASRPTGIRFTAGGDWPERDPATFELWGTDQEITTPDNGRGEEQQWTLISEGTVDLPVDPRGLSTGIIPIDDFAGYFTSYRIVFPTLRNAGATNSMQIAEVELFGAVPEPSTIALIGLGLMGVVAGRRFANR